MSAVKVNITVTGDADTIRWLSDAAEKAENNKQEGMFKSLNKIADVWKNWYDSEGEGSWDPLAPGTEEERARQGFSPAHPILVRSGALRNAAVEELLRARGPLARTFNDNYSGSGTTITIGGGANGMVINLHGRKVINHHGSRSRRPPARPIWFVDKEVLLAAADGAVEWLKDDVLAGAD